MTKLHHRTSSRLAASLLAGWLGVHGCRSDNPEFDSESSDALFETVRLNAQGTPGLEIVAEIDHARLAAEAGAAMPPARVLLVSDPAIEAALLASSPLAGLDLPIRLLAYVDPSDSKARLVVNSLSSIAQRHGLAFDANVVEAWNDRVALLLAGVDPSLIDELPAVAPDADPAIVTLDSAYGFTETWSRLLEAITSQSDTIVFAELDLSSRARPRGVDLAPTSLILFGAPRPGGRCMANAPLLGLDGFCQKLLIWEGADGVVHASFNDLLALAARQRIEPPLALRHVNRRIRDTLETAISAVSYDATTQTAPSVPAK
ncbi:MAG: hypothetical protein RLZZ565_512 [Planctomycetota bacterium]